MVRTASKRAKTKRRVYVVYLIRNLINGNRYVGKTSGPNVCAAIEQRWKQHLRFVRNGAPWNLHRAMRKHGVHNFMIGQLWVCRTERGAFELEKMEIARLRPRYNMTKGGDGVVGYKKLTSASMAAKEAGQQFYLSGGPCKQGHNSPRYVSTRQCCECHRLKYLESSGGVLKGQGNRKPRSAEFKAAVSQALTGRRKTPETRAKMIVAAKTREAARRAKKETEQCQMIL